MQLHSVTGISLFVNRVREPRVSKALVCILRGNLSMVKINLFISVGH